ncbi:unnamed protein product [Peniophora sp. CBMAI 1063]|nr:unnamed protein product [Peniophora sp. CBMAI 1063]
MYRCACCTEASDHCADSESVPDSMPSLETVSESDGDCVHENDDNWSEDSSGDSDDEAVDGDKENARAASGPDSLTAKLQELHGTYDPVAEHSQRVQRWAATENDLSRERATVASRGSPALLDGRSGVLPVVAARELGDANHHTEQLFSMISRIDDGFRLHNRDARSCMDFNPTAAPLRETGDPDAIPSDRVLHYDISCSWRRWFCSGGTLCQGTKSAKAKL